MGELTKSAGNQIIIFPTVYSCVCMFVKSNSLYVCVDFFIIICFVKYQYINSFDQCHNDDSEILQEMENDS